MNKVFMSVLMIAVGVFNLVGGVKETVESRLFEAVGSKDSPLMDGDTLHLPFNFSWCGKSHSEVDLGTFGCVNFSDGYIWVAEGVEDGEIYISQSEHSLTIRYSSTVNASLTLCDDGRFHLDYGENSQSVGGSFDFDDDGIEWYSTSLYDVVPVNKRVSISVENGLVAYYKFDGNANDSSGCGNDGTLQGETSIVLGRDGSPSGALDFKGQGWVSVLNSESLDSVTNELTIAFWLKANAWNNGLLALLSGKYPNQYGCLFGTAERVKGGGDGVWYCGPGDVEDDFKFSENFPFDEWHYWAIVSGAGTITIYCDGHVLAEKSNCGFPYVKGRDLWIGRTGSLMGVGSSYLDGALDELRIYNRALWASEVNALYRGETELVQKTWTLTFDVNCVNGFCDTDSMTCEDGLAICEGSDGCLPYAERMGYDFVGWFTEREGGIEVTDESVVSSAMTLYAHWEKIDDVEFIEQDGVLWICRESDDLRGLEIVGVDDELPKDMVIPSVLSGRKVVLICERIFAYQNSITNLVVSDGIVGMGYGTFEGCNELKSVTIAGSVKTIEGFMFNDCPNLTSAVLEDGISALNECCFGGCETLEEITLPSTLTNMERSVFANCYNLKKVIFKGARPFLNSSVVYSPEMDNIFYEIPQGLRVYVWNDEGWKDENGNRITEWCGCEVVYLLPFPELGNSATRQDVKDALKGSADERLLQRITSVTEYESYQGWVERTCGANEAKRQTVKGSSCAWLSYALDADTLMEKPPEQGEILIADFVQRAGGVRISIALHGISIGDDATMDNLANVFSVEGCESVNGEYSSENVTVGFDAASDGMAHLSVFPKGKHDAFFFKVRMIP